MRIKRHKKSVDNMKTYFFLINANAQATMLQRTKIEILFVAETKLDKWKRRIQYNIVNLTQNSSFVLCLLDFHLFWWILDQPNTLYNNEINDHLQVWLYRAIEAFHKNPVCQSSAVSFAWQYTFSDAPKPMASHGCGIHIFARKFWTHKNLTQTIIIQHIKAASRPLLIDWLL